MVDEYHQITHAIRTLGYEVSKSWVSHVAESLSISPWKDCSKWDVLRIHKREESWFISVNGPHWFALSSENRLLELCRELLEFADANKVTPSITTAINERYSLVEVSSAEWFAMEQELELKCWAEQGWHPLEEMQERSSWDQFSALCGFPESEIREPLPSCTWDVGAIMDQRDENLEREINRRCHSAFAQCAGLDGRMWVLEHRSRSYMLYPHEMNHPEMKSSWAISILPQGDYHFFLSADFRFGLLGHVDDTICVFGEELLRLFLADGSSLFGLPIRNQSEFHIGR